MSDILLDEITGDIKVVANTLILTTDIGLLVRQRLQIRLDTFLGEWFLNSEIGVPYFQTLLKKPYKELLTDSIFKGVILETEDVISITKFETTFDAKTGVYTLNFSVLDSTNSELDITILQAV